MRSSSTSGFFSKDWASVPRFPEMTEGMCNLVTDRTGTRLLLCGHVDVVPALDTGWTYPPFSGRIDDRYVYGRGSTDMKGGCASILCCMRSLGKPGWNIPATLAFVCDEETGGENGIRRLLADQALVSRRLPDCRTHASPAPQYRAERALPAGDGVLRHPCPRFALPGRRRERHHGSNGTP